MNRDQFWFTVEPFSKIAPHLPTDTPGCGPGKLIEAMKLH